MFQDLGPVSIHSRMTLGPPSYSPYRESIGPVLGRYLPWRALRTQAGELAGGLASPDNGPGDIWAAKAFSAT